MLTEEAWVWVKELKVPPVNDATVRKMVKDVQKILDVQKLK